MNKKSLSKKASLVQASSTLAIDAMFKEMKAEGKDVVGFGAGEPDFDTPEFIKNAAKEALDKGMTKYTPASGTLELKKAICEKLEKENGLSYKPSQIIVSNGAKHSLFNALFALLNPGDEVILPAPFWVSYFELIKMADGIPVILKTDEKSQYKITAKELEAAITDKTKAFILNSPSNPTGMIYTKDELKAIADVCVKHEVYVISDEIYEKLIYDGLTHTSIASFGEDIKDLTIVVNGVSKSYAMTGWRIGYTASNEQIAKVMGNNQSHATSNPNTMAQYASKAAILGDQSEAENMRKVFEERRNYMYEQINKVKKVSALKPSGAFYIMMNMEEIVGETLYGKKIENADDFCILLLEKAGVALVPLTSFGIDNYVRWSYATSKENIEEGIKRLERFIDGGY